MRKLILASSLILALTACNPTGPGSTPAADSTATDSAITTDTAVSTTTTTVTPELSTDPSINPDSIKASMKMSLQMRDTTNKL